MSSFVDVAIVGAGPYGLSLAAHLAKAGVSHRLLGRPMLAWQQHMVAGMFLKSDGPSSNLSDPAHALTLERFCGTVGQEYHQRVPIPREVFIRYGLEFRTRAVSELTEETVERIEPCSGGYALHLSNGEILTASKVVIAIGVEPFSYIPESVSGLPPERVSHSSRFGAVEHLAGQEVVVIGAGASATDVAYALHMAGAKPTIVARRAHLGFQIPPEPQTFMQKIRSPDSGIGGGWRLKTCADAPDIVHSLPLSLRQRIVRNYLGAAPGWFMRERVEGVVPALTSTNVTGATVAGNRVQLELESNGERTQREVDHVVAATGYRVDVARLGFLPAAMTARIRNLGGAPVLSRAFETSLPGVYFMGPAAALSFGPVMRFVYGADFAVRRISGHLIRGLVRRPVSVPVMASTA